MRFCPFCSAENNDDVASCSACGRRLPPLPPRRARNAQPTGVQLPQRPPGAPPPTPARRTGNTVPPLPAAPLQPPPSMPSVLAAENAIDDQVTNPSVQALPPVHAFSADDFATNVAAPAFDDADKRSLLAAISPGPAAQRRDAPVEDRDPQHARRVHDSAPALAPAVSSSPPMVPPPRPPSQPPIPRAKGSTMQPMQPAPRDIGIPIGIPPSGPRPKPPTLPPPGPHAGLRPITPPPIDPNDASSSAARASAPILHYPTLPKAADGSDQAAAGKARLPTGSEPPPTRVQRADGLVDRPFTPPRVLPVPEIPEPGLINSAKYSVKFVRARWQRRGAIKTLGSEIKQDTEALDQVLGALGREARNAKVEGRVFSAENGAIDAAELRMGALGKEHAEVDARKADENSKFGDVELERNTKLGEAERQVDEAQKELQHLEGQRRGLRDRRKEFERRQKTYLKNAEDNDRAAGSSQLGDARQDLRRSAEGHRKEAAALEPERQEMDRKLASLERPIGEATAKLDAARAELDAAKRSLTDAREGHVHRLAELDAEQKRKSREIGLAEAEIQRRLVTLGTLVNLNRIENVMFAELYERIDRIRGAITARTTEIEKLTAEREAYDRGALTRGVATIGGAILVFITLIVILRALMR